MTHLNSEISTVTMWFRLSYVYPQASHKITRLNKPGRLYWMGHKKCQKLERRPLLNIVANSRRGAHDAVGGVLGGANGIILSPCKCGSISHRLSHECRLSPSTTFPA